VTPEETEDRARGIVGLLLLFLLIAAPFLALVSWEAGAISLVAACVVALLFSKEK